MSRQSLPPFLSLSVLLTLGLACGGPALPPLTACETDGDCASDKLPKGSVCHPTGKLCVQTCEKADSCPKEQNNCAALQLFARDGGVSSGAQVCGCSNDGQCGAGLVCSKLDQVCLAPCADDSTCQGRACDVASGQCRLKHCGEDPTLCFDTQYCNDATKTCLDQKCDPDAGFLGTDGGPSSCAYGEFCPSKTGCQPVPQGGCALINGAPAWDAGARGPVMFDVKAERVTAVTTGPSAECGSTNAVLLTVKYYQPGGFVKTAKTGQQIGDNVKVNENTSFGSANFTRAPPAANAEFGQFNVGYCAVSAVNTQVGVYLADDTTGVRKTGNAICASIP